MSKISVEDGGARLRVFLDAGSPPEMCEEAADRIEELEADGWAFVELRLTRNPSRGNRGRGELRFISAAARDEAAAARSVRKRERREAR